MNKSDIRKKILKKRKFYKHKNYKINFKHILQVVKKFKIRTKSIGGYYPYNHEVDVIKVLEKFEKNKYQVSLPKIKKNSQMNFFHWSAKDPLEINKYGIPEPLSNKVRYPSIILVPLIAFDKYFNRIGYGGGFYDRYINKLKKKKKIITIGLAFTFQKVKKIKTNKHDVQLDYVITINKN